MSRCEYDLATERELIMWPGVTWRFDRRAKHLAVILTFRGQERLMTYPASGSDKRGPLKALCEKRAEKLRIALGRTRKAIQIASAA